MYVTIEQMMEGITKYGNSEFVSKVSGLRKWAVAIALPPIAMKAGSIAMDNKDMLVRAGYMTEDGMVDIDTIASKAKEVARTTGSVTENLPMLGDVTFTIDDIEALRNCIVGG